jgi:hypothetical protein
MAKVKFAPDVESISGKLCSRSGVIYAVNKQTGITHRLERHEFTDTNTEAQQAVRKTFLSKGKFAAAWWKANKPSTEKPKGSEHYLLVMKAYKGQHKIGNPYSYLCSLVTEDLKVKLGDLDITGSVSAPSAGGGSSAGSGTTGSGTTGGGGTDGDGDA